MRFTGIVTVAVAAVPLLAVLSHAAAVASDNGNWAVMARVADECARDKDTAACVAVKAAVALERAARSAGDVQLFPGLTVAKNDNGPAASTRDSRALPTEEELRGQLQYANDIPEEDDRSARVTDMLLKSAVRFLQSRTLKLDFPQTDADELARSIEEGECRLFNRVCRSVRTSPRPTRLPNLPAYQTYPPTHLTYLPPSRRDRATHPCVPLPQVAPS